MKPPVRVRLLLPSDVAQLRVWMEIAPDAPRWSAADLAQSAAGEAPATGRERRGWAAEDGDGHLCGFLVATALHLPGTVVECELEFLFVAPEQRRSGVGLALTRELMAWSDALGAEAVRLEVRELNLPARSLYGSLGFEQTGVRPAYYRQPSEDAVLMEWRRGHGSSRRPRIMAH